MIPVSSPAAFAVAVDEYSFEGVAVPATVLDGAHPLLIGEAHGRYETPAMLYALARRLDARALALEWSHEEMDGTLQSFLREGSFDFELLWTLPESAELFCGDGRITAGHFALLRRLRDEGVLRQVIAFDRHDPDPPPAWQVRDREMAERLLVEWDRRLPLLAVAGAFHARPDVPETMASRLAAELSGLRTLRLSYPEPPTATAVVPAHRPRE